MRCEPEGVTEGGQFDSVEIICKTNLQVKVEMSSPSYCVLAILRFHFWSMKSYTLDLGKVLAV